MRRAMAVLMMAVLLAIPASAAAQGDAPELLKFSDVVTGSQLTTLFPQMGADPTNATLRVGIQAEVQRQQMAMLGIDPSLCWLSQYLTYWDILGNTALSMAMFEASDVTAATALMDRVTTLFGQLDPNAMSACI